MLQIGEDVDYLLIPREVRLAGGVWRVISKPATKEAEFRERLIQFLEEEGRTLEDVARIIEKSTPHPPQPPKKPKEPQVKRRVPQMVTPPLRLVVGTYDSSNASDSELSDFETSRVKDNRRSQGARKVRKMPVSYLGSKFLGSDVESEDDQELVEAFLHRGEKKPSAPPPRRRVNLPVPMFEDNLGPQPSKADRWREYVSQVSWGKFKQRVKGWAPRSSSEVGETQQASTAAERGGALGHSHTTRGDRAGHTGDGSAGEPYAPWWRSKIKWTSLRGHRKGQVPPPAQGAGVPAEEPAEAAENQGVDVPPVQEAEAAANPRAEAPADRGAEAAANPRAEVSANPRAEALADPEAEAADNPTVEGPADHGIEAAANQRAEALPAQRAEATDNQRVEVSGDNRAETVGNLLLLVEAPADQREGAGSQALQEASAGSGAPGSAPGARAQKQVKTVRFQTPGRFSWFRKRRRAFWHTPRLPTLPKRVPRAGEARSLRVLMAEARLEAEQGEREEQV
ncbi:coiled-coil domain-containing protein 8 [Nannospalax galili]|uniref:coiled-coil domain-containing protein 8 n=1 Tax=Nannospalax galili TaxID=1026970 RepID=UPI0004ED10F2|nr:coiled-coil domain-containing protein 8 [Nannospalax galili]